MIDSERKPFHGIYAAVLTPRTAGGELDTDGLRAVLRFLTGSGVRRFAMNGATGEFPLTTPEQLRRVLATVREAAPDAELLCGVGAAGLAQSVELARIADEAGVHGLLLPTPFYFPYRQDDLAAFCTEVAAATKLSILLYNLPQFSTGYSVDTVCDLIARVPNIVGIKDSSGSLDILRALTEQLPESCRMVGNDSVLAPALEQGLCDGIVSGVACAVPETIAGVYEAAPGSADFTRHRARLDEFIAQLGPLPTPWGLKLAVDARGVLPAVFAQPLSEQRLQEAERFKQWFRGWLPSGTPATIA